MKKQLLFLSLAVLLAGGGFFAAKTIGANKLPDLTLANIEAFSAGYEAKRTDLACVYEVSGRIGGKVRFLGVGLFDVGLDGYATYINAYGRTICESNGTMECTSRYCADIPSKS